MFIDEKTGGLPLKSWCQDLETEALRQAYNLCNHSRLVSHVALMPDCHSGYGMPIGGVIAAQDAVIPYAVGVDIGCGMGAIETDLSGEAFADKSVIRKLLESVKNAIPVGEGGSHQKPQTWEGFEKFLSRLGVSEEDLGSGDPSLPGWIDTAGWNRDRKNLGTLGGGNHFIEIQKDENNRVWLMLHSGSRNLGYRIAGFHHKVAVKFCQDNNLHIPDGYLSFLDTQTEEGQAYLRDMDYALEYAMENRRRMMEKFSSLILSEYPQAKIMRAINIHHNYAATEEHGGKSVWVHRKGATSAQKGQWGIIPGSMGTSSFIVRGLGNEESFSSCSHGAGRKFSRTRANEILTALQCDQAMGDVVYDRWKMAGHKHGKKKGNMDFSEAPGAYKDIHEVIDAQKDLIEPMVRLSPLGVVKG